MEALIPLSLLIVAFAAVVFVLTRYRAARASRGFGPPPTPNDDTWVLAADAWGEANGQIILGSLHAAGIDAAMKPLLYLPRAGSEGWGRYRIYVHHRDLSDARSVLGLPALDALDV